MAKRKKRRAPAGSALMGGIAALDPSNRPRERLMAHGPRVLADAELLAIIVGSGTGGWSALDLGRKLAAGGGLMRLCKASPGDLLELHGLGEARACALVAAVELGRRALRAEEPEHPVVSDSAAAYRILRPALSGLPREAFHMLLLDSKNRLIRDVRVAEGDMRTCSVPPREVVRRALNEGAAGVIFAHNHPSGDPEPSSDDLRLTAALREALERTGVKVLDHIVVGSRRYYSLTERKECRSVSWQ